MLNLTDAPITLLAESGETTEIPASGYVARVETTRREISDQLHQCRGEGPCFFIPIIEEMPTGIAFDGPHELEVEKGDFCLLIVTREVAEAAAMLHVCADGSAECDWVGQPGGVCTKKGKRLHPLWRRMVWAEDKERTRGDIHRQEFGYRALRRVPQGENHA